MTNSDCKETIQRKIDCLILTGKLSRKTRKEIKSISTPICPTNHGVSKQTLAKVLQIRRTEERVLKRLDYWIYGELRENVSRERRRTVPVSFGSNSEQIWDSDICSPSSSNGNQSAEKSAVVGRSSSVVNTKTKQKIRRPWKNTRENAESISMFDYNMDTGIENDEVSSSEKLRGRVFSKFGTVQRRKLKMFFTRGNENDDKKSGKGSKTENNPNNDNNGNDDKSHSFLSKYRRKYSRKESRPIENPVGNDANRRQKAAKKPRPKSEASYDNFDIDKLKFDVGDSSADCKITPSTRFRDKLKSMPVFYVPSMDKNDIKTFR